MARGSAHKALIAAVLLLILAPASASAYTVRIHVHGAGTVAEVTNRTGGSRNLGGCTIGPAGTSNSSTADCVIGTADGLWNWGDIVRLEPSVDATAANRGWHFDHWTDSSAKGFINCDPQNSTGDFSNPAYCEFQIFEDLQVDLWFKDSTGPQGTAINGGPAEGTTTSATTAAFTSFSADDPDATFQCQLDPPGPNNTPSFAPCAKNGKTFTNLTQNGTWQLNVQAFDPSGNGGAVATRSWIVDTTPPTVTIGGGPTGATNATSATFTVTTSDGTLTCTLDGVGTPCGGAHNGLGEGPHTFAATATDAVGNRSAPVSRQWTVDTVAPDVTLLSGPPPGSTDTATGATFTFKSSDATATFQCKLDLAAFAPCTSPTTLSGLPNGDHTFTVRAVDAAGNASSPAIRSWSLNTRDQDHDGFDSATDCNDANAAIHPGAEDLPDDGIDQDCNGRDAHNADQDGDGVSEGTDCNDHDAAIHPGATDTPGDGIDQDCDGTDATVPNVPGGIRYKFFTQGPKTTILVLKLTDLTAPQTSVTVTCKGKGCKFKSRKATVGASRTLDVRKLLRKAPLKAGQTLSVKIAAPGHRPRAAKFTIRRGKLPKGGALLAV